jgi:hypothetical protein
MVRFCITRGKSLLAELLRVTGITRRLGDLRWVATNQSYFAVERCGWRMHGAWRFSPGISSADRSDCTAFAGKLNQSNQPDAQEEFRVSIPDLARTPPGPINS